MTKEDVNYFIESTKRVQAAQQEACRLSNISAENKAIMASLGIVLNNQVIIMQLLRDKI